MSTYIIFDLFYISIFSSQIFQSSLSLTSFTVNQMNEELSGWKLVVGDVFRILTNPLLLCAIVSDKVQYQSSLASRGRNCVVRWLIMDLY